MRIQYKLCVAILSAVFVVAPVQADPPPGKGKPNHSNSSKDNSSKDKSNKGYSNNGKQDQVDMLDVVLSSLLSAGVTQTYARDLALTHGLTGYQGLPPGIQKNLARGKPLPPGIAKKLVPNAMAKQLPQYVGYEWRVAGTELILVNLASLAVVEVLKNVFD